MNHSTVLRIPLHQRRLFDSKTALAGTPVALMLLYRLFHSDFRRIEMFQFQHLVNVLAGVFLGRLNSMAFCVSLIRNILGSCLLFLEVRLAVFWRYLFDKKTGRFLLAYPLLAVNVTADAGIPE